MVTLSSGIQVSGIATEINPISEQFRAGEYLRIVMTNFDRSDEETQIVFNMLSAFMNIISDDNSIVLTYLLCSNTTEIIEVKILLDTIINTGNPVGAGTATYYKVTPTPQNSLLGAVALVGAALGIYALTKIK